MAVWVVYDPKTFGNLIIPNAELGRCITWKPCGLKMMSQSKTLELGTHSTIYGIELSPCSTPIPAIPAAIVAEFPPNRCDPNPSRPAPTSPFLVRQQ